MRNADGLPYVLEGFELTGAVADDVDVLPAADAARDDLDAKAVRVRGTLDDVHDALDVFVFASDCDFVFVEFFARAEVRVVVADGVDRGAARALHRGEVPVLVEALGPRRVLFPGADVRGGGGGFLDAGLALVDLGAHGADEVAWRGHDAGLLGDELREGLERAAGGVDEGGALGDDGWVVPGGGELGGGCVVANHGAVKIGDDHDGLGRGGGGDRGTRAGSHGECGARGGAGDASGAGGGHGAARAARDGGRHHLRNGVHLDHARRREAWAEDRAIEPEDARVDDVDSRAGVGTDDGVKPRALESGTTRRGSVDRKKIAPNLKLGCFHKNGFPNLRASGGGGERGDGGARREVVKIYSFDVMYKTGA